MKKNINTKTGFLGFGTGFINGLFGAGGGTILVLFMERLLHIKAHEAHATAIGVILPLSIISSCIYIKNNVVDWNILLFVAIGGMIGGFVGAKILSKVSSKWIHRIFGLFMITAAVRMII